MASSPVTPRVAVILINLNQEDHTRECIDSLLRVTYAACEIILIDNNSSDGSGERLHHHFPSVTYRRLEENLGFAGGNNAGIDIALAHNAEYVLLLNNDTVVDANFIQPLVEVAASEASLGAQCGKIYQFSRRQTLWYAGGILHVDKAYANHRGMWENDVGQYDKIEETDFASGCMFFVPSRVIRETGMLDDRLFIYQEDTDWCVRMKERGYRIIYNPNSRIWHKVSVTNKIDSPFYLYFTIRNKIIFLRKHSRPSRWLQHVPYFLYFFARHLIRMSMKWHSMRGTRAVLFGIIDGLRNFTGPNGKGRFEKLLA